MLKVFLACAIVNAIVVRADPQIKTKDGNVLVVLPEAEGTLNVLQGMASNSYTIDPETAVVTAGNLQTSVDSMEADFVSRLEALETKFVGQLEEQAKTRTAELAELKKAQEEAANATQTKIQEAVDAVQFGVVIAPGDDIAAVVREMAAEGGKVFLKRGIHELSQTLVVDKPITFVGEGSATILKGTGAGAVVKIAGATAGSPLMHVTMRSLQVECSVGKATPGLLLENVEASFIEHLQFESCATDILMEASTQNWIQDNKMSYDSANVKMGGIEEAKSSKENVIRRNLFGSGFETNLLEAPTFNFKEGQKFSVQSGCVLEVNLLKEVAVPSVNPFELEYLARIKKSGLATVLDARYLATVNAVDTDKLPEGATINTTTGVLSWRPTQQQGGKEFTIAFVATGARDDVSYAKAEFKVIESFNIAVCKEVVDWTEDKYEADPDAACQTSADPQAATDGQRPNGMTWKKLDGAVPFITIDLEKSQKVKSIAIFQPKNAGDRTKKATLKFSDDNEEFGLVASGSLALNAPGLLGAVFNIEAEGRYVRIEGDGSGIGEVELYAETVTTGVTDLVASSGTGKTVKLSWDVPEKFNKVRVLRNPMKKAASLSNFPASPDDGVVVYEGKASKFTDEDKNLKAGERYFYSAFAYHSDSGWSLVEWSSVDSVVVSAVNANIAGYKQVTSNLDAAGLTDGELTSGMQGTNGNQVGDKLTAVIDLKSKQDFQEIHVYQHDSHNYHLLLAELSISDDALTWTKFGKVKMDLSQPNRLGTVLKKAGSARYVKIEASEKGSYYWGLAEVEIFQFQKPNPPYLEVELSDRTSKTGSTSVDLKWTNPNNLEIKVVRQTLVAAGSLKNFPAGPDVGTLVYKGKGLSVTDKNLPTDVQHFYSAFAFHGETGWSSLHWDAVETARPGDPNPNLALEKKTTSSIDYNARGASHRVVDGSRTGGDLHTTNGAKVDDYTWVVVDLKRIVSIETVVIWQSFSAHYNHQFCKVKHSQNGEDWSTMGSSEMYVSHTGSLGAQINAVNGGARTRYIRVEVSKKVGYYFGLGEIEIFQRKPTDSPVIHTSQIINSDKIKVEFNAPGSSQVIILRKKFTDQGKTQRYSHSRHDGQVVLKTGSSAGNFVDKEVENGVRYYYTAFARSANRGWSIVDYDGCDNVVSGGVNPNLALSKKVRASHNNQITYGSADAVNDGERQNGYSITNGDNMADGLRVDIDLKKVRRIREVIIWQSSSEHFKMNRFTIYFSNDKEGKNWNKYQSNLKAELQKPGGKGLTLRLNRDVRWIRVDMNDKAGYYWGIGEVEVYEKPTTASPKNLIASNDGGNTKLTWEVSGGQRVQLRRKKNGGPGNLYSWPTDHNDGVLLLDTKSAKSFVDKTAGAGKWWYYAVFVYNTNTGWSLIAQTAIDVWCAACDNPNLAHDKPLSGSTVDATVTYGRGNGAVDGQRESGPSTTNGAKLKKYNYKIGFVVDLKKVRKIRQIIAWQSSGYTHFGMNYCQLWGSTQPNSGWRSHGNKEMYKDYPGGLGYIWNLDIDVRYVRLSCSQNIGYYYGFGELEVYESAQHGNPVLTTEPGSKATEAKVSWKNSGGTELVTVRRTSVNGGAGRDSYPPHHEKGTEVYRGTGTSFTDVDLTEGGWYYYSAFAYKKGTGWSLINTDACDAVQAGSSNQNYARGSFVLSNMGRSLTYGEPHQLCNGNLDQGPASAAWSRMQFGWRPSGTKAWVKIDLGKERSIVRFKNRNKSLHWQHRRLRIYTSNTGSGWNRIGDWNMPYGSSKNPSNTVVEKTFGRRTARYLYIVYWQAPGNYYYGAGEFELFGK